MIKLNKDSNSPKMERASAPGIKVKKYNIKGELSVPQLGAVQGAALLTADGTVLFCEQIGKESQHFEH